MLIIKSRDILITKGYCYRTKNERVSIDIKNMAVSMELN